jgi:signal transduction histidine kinase
MQGVSEASYRFVYFNMDRLVMLIWTVMALMLFGLLLAAAISHMESGIRVSLPYEIASFLFQFAPAFVVGLYTWFWTDVDTFCRATQPFIGMREPKPAAENILLDYNCLPAGLVTYTAIVNMHWKVARVSAISLVQRLLPIIVASMVTVVDDGDHRTVYASLPLLVISMIFLGSYVCIIPFEVTEDGLKRHLPRNYSAIADLISWCYASSLLQCDALAASGPDFERWQMEAAIRLKRHSYQFGVYRSKLHPGTHCVGFDEQDEAEPVDLPDKKSLLRRRRRASHDLHDQLTWEMSELTGLDDFKERPMDTSTFQFAVPHGEEEPAPNEA